jgi:hypothetical protein
MFRTPSSSRLAALRLAALGMLLPWAALAPLQARAENLSWTDVHETLGPVRVSGSGSTFSGPGVAYMTWIDYTADIVTTTQSYNARVSPDGCCYVQLIPDFSTASYVSRVETYFDDLGQESGTGSSETDVSLDSTTGMLVANPGSDVVVTTTPEPTSFTLMGLGVLGLLAWQAVRARRVAQADPGPVSVPLGSRNFLRF